MEAVHHCLLQPCHQSPGHPCFFSPGFGVDPPVEHSIIPKVREPCPGSHEHLVSCLWRISPRLESAAEAEIRIREQSAANLVLGQHRFLPLRIHHGIQVPVYPVDVALLLVIIDKIGHRRPLPHHLRDILQSEASQLPHPLIILDTGKPSVLPVISVSTRLRHFASNPHTAVSRQDIRAVGPPPGCAGHCSNPLARTSQKSPDSPSPPCRPPKSSPYWHVRRTFWAFFSPRAFF